MRWYAPSRGAWSFAVTLAMSSACQADTPRPEAGTVPGGAPTEVASDPHRVVGDASSGVDLHQVVTPFLMEDGRLVIPERDGSIRIFGPEGDLLETLGGSGSGPGEFRAITGAWARGDTLEVHDMGVGRLTRFLPEGSLQLIDLREVPFIEPIAGALPDGWAFTRIRAAPLGGRDDMAVVRVNAEGELLGEVAELQGMERHALPGASGPGPLSPRIRVAVGGGVLHLAETEMPVIRRLTPEGEVAGEVRWDPGLLPSPQEARQQVMDSIEARAEPAERPALMERMAAFPVEDRVPEFSDFRVDPEGFYWIQPFEPGRHSMALGWVGGGRTDGEWWIVGDDGARLGSVTVPEGLRISQITRDAVVGVHRDALGVESVRVYALERAGRQAAP